MDKKNILRENNLSGNNLFSRRVNDRFGLTSPQQGKLLYVNKRDQEKEDLISNKESQL